MLNPFCFFIIIITSFSSVLLTQSLASDITRTLPKISNKYSIKCSNLKVSDSLTVSARVYTNNETLQNKDDSASSVGVVWLHGFDSHMEVEDINQLWCFWDDDTSDYSGAADLIVRYNCRGHRDSSPTTDLSQTTWYQLGIDMLSISALCKQKVREEYGMNVNKIVLGGASMGAGSTLHAVNEMDGDGISQLAGIMLVIPPTCYETRLQRRDQLIAYAKAKGKSYNMDEQRKPRNIFGKIIQEGKRGVSNGSFENTVIGAANSNFPSRSILKKKLEKIPVLILAWDLDDEVHPLSSVDELVNHVCPHAKVLVSKSKESLESWPRVMNEFISSI